MTDGLGRPLGHLAYWPVIPVSKGASSRVKSFLLRLLKSHSLSAPLLLQFPMVRTVYVKRRAFGESHMVDDRSGAPPDRIVAFEFFRRTQVWLP